MDLHSWHRGHLGSAGKVVVVSASLARSIHAAGWDGEEAATGRGAVRRSPDTFSEKVMQEERGEVGGER
jgi:hypothetical protein